jgi:endonuclease/exonuclease/phosphatase family metal-dependent hydrolase
MWCLNYWPAELERVRVRCAQAPGPGAGAGALRPGERFRLLSWNIQFAASRRYHFFYDGGPAVHADWDVVQQTLDRIAEVIRAEDPDLVLLQEVDRDSDRTARIDQALRLRQALGWRCWASTPYHRSRYVPVPLRRPLGRVDFHLVTASAHHPLRWARRRALPLLQEPWWRRAFNLKRAVLETAVAVAGRDRPLVLLNTHLSAFSGKDGTLRRQVEVIAARLAFLDRRSIPWILAGDFNALPPGDTPARLGAESRLYSAGDSPIAPLVRRYRSGVSRADYARHPQRYYTYLPYGADAPDRRIDYVFVSEGVRIHDLRVVRQERPLSDHLPLRLEASLVERSP